MITNSKILIFKKYLVFSINHKQFTGLNIFFQKNNLLKSSNKIFEFHTLTKQNTNTYKKMSFETKILPVIEESVIFDEKGNVKFTDKTTEQNILLASDELNNTNNVVAFPTETVYGLGGSVFKDESIKSIFKAKNRPSDNPLIIHVSSIEQIKRKLFSNNYEIPEIYNKLIQKFWPGPLSILLPIGETSHISKLVTANQKFFAVRIPKNSVTRALIHLSDTPLAGPSANTSTKPSSTNAQHVFDDLYGKIPYILDSGPCNIGLESTIVDGLSTPPLILRPGGISIGQIKESGGPEWKNVSVYEFKNEIFSVIKSPGLKYKHYSPKAKVVLFLNCGLGSIAISNYIKKNNIIFPTKIALLTTFHFSPLTNYNNLIVIKKCLGSSISKISHNLFHYLRDVDKNDISYIFIEGVEINDDNMAVLNRLTKASFEIIKQ